MAKLGTYTKTAHLKVPLRQIWSDCNNNWGLVVILKITQKYKYGNFHKNDGYKVKYLLL